MRLKRATDGIGRKEKVRINAEGTWTGMEDEEMEEGRLRRHEAVEQHGEQGGREKGT